MNCEKVQPSIQVAHKLKARFFFFKTVWKEPCYLDSKEKQKGMILISCNSSCLDYHLLFWVKSFMNLTSMIL
jgi:hypothetical protein